MTHFTPLFKVGMPCEQALVTVWEGERGWDGMGLDGDGDGGYVRATASLGANSTSCGRDSHGYFLWEKVR
jgi:hypothetical protein